MFKIQWDKETGGILLTSLVTRETINIPPRPVFFEELDLLHLDELGWAYPRCNEPLLWACNKDYFYRGEKVFEVKGANIYDQATVIFVAGKEQLSLEPVDMPVMLERNKEKMFLCESEAIEFIRDTYDTYTKANRLTQQYVANQVDFEQLVANQEKRTKQKMAIVKQDCDSFDIMPKVEADKQGKKILQTTKVDYFIASFSGGKDSQVVLDLCTRALPPDAFQVIYADTGYELPSSLELYEEIRKYYGNLYPTLRFRTAKNHESVLNYWDKIGTPSDKHRWCCSIMKTAPIYRMLKIPGTNKQAKVLAFDGVRSEESTRRSGYERIGRGVKHSFVTNARPILRWNTAEIFLYLFRNNLPINIAYRLGKPRVGCVLCPFSSSWDDMIVNQCYEKELRPFLSRIVDWAKERTIPNLDEYIKDRKWRLRASGNLITQNSSIVVLKSMPDFVAEVKYAKVDIFIWLTTIGEFKYSQEKDTVRGEIQYERKIYDFSINYKDKNNYTFILYNAFDVSFVRLIKRVLYKTIYCISCEVCEVECPTGALSVYPIIEVKKNKCIHCHKCLNFHDYGCVVANSLVPTMENKIKVGNISKYGTFGIHEDWLLEFLVRPEVSYWIIGNNSLGSKQIPSFKSWLKDADIIDSKNILTEFGEICKTYITDNSDLIWSLIWINLSYNSNLVNWFVNNISSHQQFERSQLMDLSFDYFATSSSRSTIEYAFQAFMQLFTYSPIGKELKQGEKVNKKLFERKEYTDVSEIAVAYSLYKFAEGIESYNLRLSDFFTEGSIGGPAKEFSLSKDLLEKKVRTLNSQSNRVLVAELNMGLDHITLKEDLTPIKVLKQMLS